MRPDKYFRGHLRCSRENFDKGWGMRVKQADSGIGIMLVGRNKTILRALTQLIELRADTMHVIGHAPPHDARRACLHMQPDVLVFDLEPGANGALELLPPLLDQCGGRVLIFTAERRRETLDTAVRLGARGMVEHDVGAEEMAGAICALHAGALWLDDQTLIRALHGAPAATARRDGRSAPHPYACLTRREQSIVNAVALGAGASNKVLAAALFISEHTLRNHLTAIYHKLGVSNRVELYAFTTRHRPGLDRPEPARRAAVPQEISVCR